MLVNVIIKLVRWRRTRAWSSQSAASGRGSWISSCPVWAMPSDWETSGGFPTSASGTGEVRIGTGIQK